MPWFFKILILAPPKLNIGIQSNFTGKRRIWCNCATLSYFSICQKNVKITLIFVTVTRFFISDIFSNFWLSHLVRAVSPTLFITIHSSFTERIYIVNLCNDKFFFALSKIFNFSEFWFFPFRHFTSEFDQTLQEKGIYSAVAQRKVNEWARYLILASHKTRNMGDHPITDGCSFNPFYLLY